MTDDLSSQKQQGIAIFEPATVILTLIMIKAAHGHCWQSETPGCKLKLRSVHHFFNTV